MRTTNLFVLVTAFISAWLLERDSGSAQPYDIAEVYAYHNNNDRAFEWLERQYRVDPKFLRGEIHSEPLANLRGDARFKALLRKLKLPE